MTDRPLLSYVVYAFDQEAFVEEAVASAFSQTYEPLQVILSDDCSSDATFEIMSRMAASYTGPHAVVLNRNGRNLGTRRHLNAACRLGGGELFVLAAGDDASIPGRTSTVFQAYEASGRSARSIMSDFAVIGPSGEPMAGSYSPDPTLGYEDFLEDRLSAYGATQSVHREVFDFFGDLPFGFHEDQILFHRALLLGTWSYIPQRLVKHRRHSANVSGGENARTSEPRFRQFWQGSEIDSMTGNAGILQDYLFYCRAHPERLSATESQLIMKRLRRAHMMWCFFSHPSRRWAHALLWCLRDRVGLRYLLRSTRSLLGFRVRRLLGR